MKNNFKQDAVRELAGSEGSPGSHLVLGKDRPSSQDVHDVKFAMHKGLEAALPEQRAQRAEVQGGGSLTS